MLPGMDPKLMKQAMKKLGMKQEEIDASEIIIKTSDKELIFKNPQVIKVEAMGQTTYQIIGNPEERSLEKFTEEDIKTVMQQANCSKEKAKKALEKSDGDLAEAILSLTQ